MGVKLARQCYPFTGGSSWMFLPQHLVCPVLAMQMPGWGVDGVGHTTDQHHQDGEPSPGFWAGVTSRGRKPRLRGTGSTTPHRQPHFSLPFSISSKNHIFPAIPGV